MDGIVKSVKERLRDTETENRQLKAENAKLKAIVEYIGVLDYPEIFEEEEAVNE